MPVPAPIAGSQDGSQVADCPALPGRGKPNAMDGHLAAGRLLLPGSSSVRRMQNMCTGTAGQPNLVAPRGYRMKVSLPRPWGNPTQPFGERGDDLPPVAQVVRLQHEAAVAHQPAAGRWQEYHVAQRTASE